MTSEEANKMIWEFTEREYEAWRKQVTESYCYEIAQMEDARREKVVRRKDVEYIKKCLECLTTGDTEMFFKIAP